MNKEVGTHLYIAGFAITAVVLGVWAAYVWPIVPDVSVLWLLPVLVLLIVVADHFAVMISRQADSSLYTVPLYIGVLLAHPTEAALVGAVGVLISQILAKRPFRAIVFNVGMVSVSASVAGIVFFSLRPAGTGLELTQEHIIAAALAGLVLHMHNILPLIGIITIRKGIGFWQFWTESYVITSTVDVIVLSLGLMAALIAAQASWGLALMILPAIGAHYVLKNTVEYSAKKGILAEELGERVRRELDRLKSTPGGASRKSQRSMTTEEGSVRKSWRRHLR